MNTPFHLKRFLLLEQYGKRETGRNLLWAVAIVLGICMLCILADINQGGSDSQRTSGIDLCRYTLWFLCIAPCLFESHLTKRNSILYVLLPASTFEKFLHIWVKYLLLLPLCCAVLIGCVKVGLSLTGVAYLQHFAADISPYEVRRDQLLTYCILHALFFISCLAFRRKMLLKAFSLSVLTLIVSLVLATVVTLFLPDDRQGYWFSNMATLAITNVPLSATAQALVDVCNYAAPACLVLGSWISGYFLLKEKQL